MKLPVIFSAALGMGLFGCGGGEDTPGGPKGDFPVNEAFAAELVAKGVPADVARFFAAAKMEAHCPDDTSCIYLQTFPNLATREMTLSVDPNRQYTPTAEEVAKVGAGASALYAFEYASSVPDDSTVQTDMKYYVGAQELPQASIQQGLAGEGPWPGSQVQAADGTGAGAGIAWGEIGRSGADVTIGSLIDYAQSSGLNVGPLGSVYALASALSNVTSALDLSKQNLGWLAELDALEKCAANPTNPVAKSDPKYSNDTVAKIQAARSELQQVNAMRFLNQMTETGSGLTPVTAVLSVGLKQGFVWNESTLGDYSENTIMREAREAVVKCDTSGMKGNVDVLVTCPDDGILLGFVTHIVASVEWVWDPMAMTYRSQGTYTYDSTETGGCLKKSATGSINDTGSLMTIDDPTARQVLGFGYTASGFVTDTVTWNWCTGNSSQTQEQIDWLPNVTGFLGTGGSIEGVKTSPSCVGATVSGTETVTYSFAVPPKE